MATKDLKDAIIEIHDGAGNFLEIKDIGEGNLTWTVKTPYEYKKNRGKLGSVRKADEEPVDVSLEAAFDYVISSGSEDITVTEALTRTGAASGWISTSPDPCEPYCVDIVVKFKNECDDGSLDEVVTLPQFRTDERGYDVSAGSISVPGKCNVTDILAQRIDV
jgi:hypothetical protein